LWPDLRWTNVIVEVEPSADEPTRRTSHFALHAHRLRVEAPVEDRLQRDLAWRDEWRRETTRIGLTTDEASDLERVVARLVGRLVADTVLLQEAPSGAPSV